MEKEPNQKMSFKPIIGLAVVSLLVCGVFFPLLITGIAQVAFPYQANGEIVYLDGKPVGSNLIAQGFTSPLFFHARTDSASGVDPDITLNEANAQIFDISRATGISSTELTSLVNADQEGALWIFGSPYVNVLRLNLDLIRQYPSVYSSFRVGSNS